MRILSSIEELSSPSGTPLSLVLLPLMSPPCLRMPLGCFGVWSVALCGHRFDPRALLLALSLKFQTICDEALSLLYASNKVAIDFIDLSLGDLSNPQRALKAVHFELQALR